MDLQLKNKVALVTAASRGLGYATARVLAEEGAHIVMCSRNVEAINEAGDRLAEETGATVLPIPANVAHAADVERLVTQTLARFGRIDALFINIGGPPTGRFVNFTPEDWDDAIQLTVQSAVRLCYAVVPVMREQKSGSILANTSVTVKHSLDNLMLSNSLRLAVIGLMKSLSIELGPENIRVNAIAPGWTRTERVDEILRARMEQNTTTMDDEAALIAANVPLRRMADPLEFGRAAAFLLSPAASYVTGITLLVDGGMTKAVM